MVYARNYSLSLQMVKFRIKAVTWGMNALTLILLTWRIWWATNNASRWQMGFNSAFKELIKISYNVKPTNTQMLFIYWHGYVLPLVVIPLKKMSVTLWRQCPLCDNLDSRYLYTCMGAERGGEEIRKNNTYTEWNVGCRWHGQTLNKRHARGLKVTKARRRA